MYKKEMAKSTGSGVATRIKVGAIGLILYLVLVLTVIPSFAAWENVSDVVKTIVTVLPPLGLVFYMAFGDSLF